MKNPSFVGGDCSNKDQNNPFTEVEVRAGSLASQQAMKGKSFDGGFLFSPFYFLS